METEKIVSDSNSRSSIAGPVSSQDMIFSCPCSKIMTLRKHHVLLTIFLFWCGFDLFAQPPIGKVVDSSSKGTTTYLLIEATRMLNTYQPVYLYGDIRLVITEVMSIREKEGIYYYRAQTRGKIRVLPGENVFVKLAHEKNKFEQFETEAIFMKKKHGTITLVDGKKIIVNRGSLHNVDKRDVYKVYGPDGQAKGKIELYGVGDFISAGHSYYSFFEGNGQAQLKEGDTVIYIGNRKLAGTGILAVFFQGDSSDSLKAESGKKRYNGGGSFWSANLKTIGSAEFLLGALHKEKYPSGLKRLDSYYTLPVWFRKTFNYPGLFSPSMSLVAVGDIAEFLSYCMILLCLARQD